MIALTSVLADGFFAAIASIGFAIISNPPKKVLFMAGVLAAIGHMTRYSLMHGVDMGISIATLWAAIVISLGGIVCSKRLHTPAEIFCFPALLPMIPGMFAYKTILGIMQFLGASEMVARQEYLADITYNGLITFFVMSALVIGAIVPLLSFHHESALWKGFHNLWRRGDRKK